MAYDRYDSEFHLTPQGWIQSNNGPPSSRVETWNLHVEQASGWSKEYRHWLQIWEDPNVPLEERDNLRKKYGERPR